MLGPELNPGDSDHTRLEYKMYWCDSN